MAAAHPAAQSPQLRRQPTAQHRHEAWCRPVRPSVQRQVHARFSSADTPMLQPQLLHPHVAPAPSPASTTGSSKLTPASGDRHLVLNPPPRPPPTAETLADLQPGNKAAAHGAQQPDTSSRPQVTQHRPAEEDTAQPGSADYLRQPSLGIPRPPPSVSRQVAAVVTKIHYLAQAYAAPNSTIAALLNGSKVQPAALQSALRGMPLLGHAVLLAACAHTGVRPGDTIMSTWGQLLLPLLLQAPEAPSRLLQQQAHSSSHSRLSQPSPSQLASSPPAPAPGDHTAMQPQSVRHIRHLAALISLLESMGALHAHIGLVPMSVLMLQLQPQLPSLSAAQLVGITHALADMAYFPYTAPAVRLAGDPTAWQQVWQQYHQPAEPAHTQQPTGGVGAPAVTASSGQSGDSVPDAASPSSSAAETHNDAVDGVTRRVNAGARRPKLFAAAVPPQHTAGGDRIQLGSGTLSAGRPQTGPEQPLSAGQQALSDINDIVSPLAVPPPPAWLARSPKTWMTALLLAVGDRLDTFSGPQVCALVKSLARLDLHPWAANSPHQQLQQQLAIAVAGQQRWRLDVMDLLPRPRRAAAALQPSRPPAESQDGVAAQQANRTAAQQLVDAAVPRSMQHTLDIPPSELGQDRLTSKPVRKGVRYELFRPHELHMSLWVLLHLSLPIKKGWQRLLLVSAAQHAFHLTPRGLLAVFRVMAEYRSALPSDGPHLQRLWQAVLYQWRHFSPAAIASLLWYAHHAGTPPPPQVLSDALTLASERAALQRQLATAGAVAASAPGVNSGDIDGSSSAPEQSQPLPPGGTVKAVHVVQLLMVAAAQGLRLPPSQALPLAAVLGTGLSGLTPALVALGLWSLAACSPGMLQGCQHQQAARTTNTPVAAGRQSQVQHSPEQQQSARQSQERRKTRTAWQPQHDACGQLRRGMDASLGTLLRDSTPAQCTRTVWALQVLGMELPVRGMAVPLLLRACQPASDAPTPQQDSRPLHTAQIRSTQIRSTQIRPSMEALGTAQAVMDSSPEAHLLPEEAAMVVCCVAQLKLATGRFKAGTAASQGHSRQAGRTQPGSLSRAAMLVSLLPALISHAQTAAPGPLLGAHPVLLPSFIAAVSKLRMGQELSYPWWHAAVAEVGELAEQGGLSVEALLPLFSAAARTTGRAGRQGTQAGLFGVGLDVGSLMRALTTQCERRSAALGSTGSASAQQHTRTMHSQSSWQDLPADAMVDVVCACADASVGMAQEVVCQVSGALVSKVHQLSPGDLGRAVAALGRLHQTAADSNLSSPGITAGLSTLTNSNSAQRQSVGLLAAVLATPPHQLHAALRMPPSIWAARTNSSSPAAHAWVASVGDLVCMMRPDQLASLLLGVSRAGAHVPAPWLDATLQLIQARAPGHMSHVGIRTWVQALKSIGAVPAEAVVECLHQQLLACRHAGRLTEEEHLSISSQLQSLCSLASPHKGAAPPEAAADAVSRSSVAPKSCSNPDQEDIKDVSVLHSLYMSHLRRALQGLLQVALGRQPRTPVQL